MSDIKLRTMSVAYEPDWSTIRRRAKGYPENAYQFVRHGLSHTAKAILGEAPGEAEANAPRHITGQQLCLGLRDLAIERYGFLAPTVLQTWNVRSTEDFGVMVYALIDREEMRSSPEDRFEDFIGVYDFDEVFAADQRV